MAASGEAKRPEGTGGAGGCPICRKPRHAAFRPFCSQRCADVDLGRWLGGTYAIPVVEDDDEDGDGAVPSVRRDDAAD